METTLNKIKNKTSRLHRDGLVVTDNPLKPQLENQMERAVLEVINDILLLETQDRFCNCEKFRADAAALALNQLRPRYATSFHGSLYTLESIQADQDLQASIRREAMNALQVAASTPFCQDPECPLMARLEATAELSES